MAVTLTANCDGCGTAVEDEYFCRNCSVEPGGASDSAELAGDLAAAIRRGDGAEAEHLLDRLAADMPGWSDRIAVSRYSLRARLA
jgi:hypothetical protein